MKSIRVSSRMDTAPWLAIVTIDARSWPSMCAVCGTHRLSASECIRHLAQGRARQRLPGRPPTAHARPGRAASDCCTRQRRWSALRVGRRIHAAPSHKAVRGSGVPANAGSRAARIRRHGAALRAGPRASADRATPHSPGRRGACAQPAGPRRARLQREIWAVRA